MERKHTVSLCMIVKNEESCLRRCLESLDGLIDEIIIVDTGSTDHTIEITKEFNAIIKTYQWNNDFAAARNYGLSFATKDWILVLDADEYLRQDDREQLVNALNDFNYDCYFIKTLNFITSATDKNYMVNLNQRIFKNHKGFKYVGSIHEQVQYFGEPSARLPNKVIEVGFYHTGYLRATVEFKHKPQRNIEILNKILEKEPNNPFHKFNLANEMFQLNKYDEAIRLYDEVYYSSNKNQGFMPKLIVFRINAYMTNEEYEKALEAIYEGIKLYPTYTHLWFLKANLEEQFGLITKAVDTYQKCLTLGKPTPELEFSENSYGLWPHLKLANLFETYHDYEKAIQHYNACLTLDNRQYQILYRIAWCLKKLKLPEERIVIELEKYLKPIAVNNKVLLADLLLKQSYFQGASRYLAPPNEVTNSQLIYLYAKQQFYLGNYRESEQSFKQYLSYDQIHTIAPYLYLIYLITGDLEVSPIKIRYPETIQRIDQSLQESSTFKLVDEDIRMIMLLAEECLISNQDEIFGRLAQVEEVFSNRVLTISFISLYLKYDLKQQAQPLLLKLISQDQIIKKDTFKLFNQLMINERNM